MNPIVKQKWVAALRSGEYKQGQKRLRNEEGFGDVTYCCLGVLVDLYCKEHNTTFGQVCEYGREVLPDRVVEWAGIDPGLYQNNPEVDGRVLAEWNDIQMAGFDHIAELIERNL